MSCVTAAIAVVAVSDFIAVAFLAVIVLVVVALFVAVENVVNCFELVKRYCLLIFFSI